MSGLAVKAQTPAVSAPPAPYSAHTTADSARLLHHPCPPGGRAVQPRHPNTGLPPGGHVWCTCRAWSVVLLAEYGAGGALTAGNCASTASLDTPILPYRQVGMGGVRAGRCPRSYVLSMGLEGHLPLVIVPLPPARHSESVLPPGGRGGVLYGQLSQGCPACRGCCNRFPPDLRQ